MRPFITLLCILFCFFANAKIPVPNIPAQKSSLAFIENKGQVTDQHHQPRKDIQFKLNAPGIDIFIGDGQIHFQWSKVNDSMAQLRNSAIRVEDSKLTGAGENEPIINQTSYITYRMDVILLNANTNAKIITEDAQDYYENYYLPQCPDGATAHSFKKITYKNIYPDIDWVIYIGGQSQILNQKSYMKYDFIVHPGGNPKDIQIQYNGATSLKLNNGALTASTPFGSITENIPYTYEANTKKKISSKFLLKDNILSFDVEQHNGTIVIDPQLEWATYYGGSGNETGALYRGNAIAVDDSGFAYFGGGTNSPSNITTVGSYQVNLVGDADAFLAKVNEQCIMQWATYFGGLYSEGFNSIFFSDNHLYTGGWTSSEGLGTIGVYQQEIDTHKLPGSSYIGDALLCKFTTAGQRLWTTYFGGEDQDFVNDLIVKANALYFVGYTYSQTGIASLNAHQVATSDGFNTFLVKFDTTGNRLWSTYYGGDKADMGECLALDKFDNIYIAGNTQSGTNIATPGSYLPTKQGNSTTSFFAKFDNDGNRIWGTYAGYYHNNSISSRFGILDMTVDAMQNIYIVGRATDTAGIATPGAYKEKNNDKDDAYIIKFNSSVVKQWGTYFGGNGIDLFQEVIIDNNGDMCLMGLTGSTTDIATTGAWQKPFGGGGRDGMFVKFDSNGNRLWATYYGGEIGDQLFGLSFDQLDNMYFLGSTNSFTGIATSGSYQDVFGGMSDLFLLKILPDSILYLELPFNDTIICIDTNGAHFRVNYIVSRSFRAVNIFTVQLSDSNGSFASPTVIGTKAATYSGYIDCVIPINTPRAKGYRIRVVASAPYYASLDNGIDIELKDGPEKPIAIGDTFLCTGETLHLSATCATAGVSFTWTGPNNFTASTANTERENITLTDAGLYVVTVSPPECKARDTVSTKVFRSPAKPTITHNAPICEGDTLTFDFVADTDTNTFYTVGWPNPKAILGQNSLVDSATLVFTGQYIVVANNNGCITADTSFIFIKPLPVLKPTSNSPLYAGQDLKLSITSDSTTYYWEGPDWFTSLLHNPVVPNVTSYNSGIYTVTGIRNGCTSKADIIVQVNELDDDFFVLFPNPNDGRFTIRGNLRSDQSIQMVVVNDIGQEIFTDKVATNKKTINHSVTLPPVANGVYMLHLRVNGKAKVLPFVVRK